MSNPMSGSTPRKRGPLGGRGPVRGPVEKAKDFKGSMKKLLQYLGKYKFRIFGDGNRHAFHHLHHRRA